MTSADPPKDDSASSASTPSLTGTSNGASTSSTNVLWTWFQNFADEQNMDRLKNCEQLAGILQACQAREYDQVPPLDQVRSGKKWMNYFGWRELSIVNAKGCIPEQHALWACRASSLRCGTHVQLLKKCFDEQGLEAVLGQRKTAYSSAKIPAVKDQIPCYDLQRAVGKCVAKNANELEERRSNIKHS